LELENGGKAAKSSFFVYRSSFIVLLWIEVKRWKGKDEEGRREGEGKER
jgi:hypothetical protein